MRKSAKRMNLLKGMTADQGRHEDDATGPETVRPDPLHATLDTRFYMQTDSVYFTTN
jgi:hypothetical protein